MGSIEGSTTVNRFAERIRNVTEIHVISSLNFLLIVLYIFLFKIFRFCSLWDSSGLMTEGNLIVPLEPNHRRHIVSS